MTRIKVCEENKEAEEQLPGKIRDGSGIGVHYMDEYIKPMNVTAEDGTKITCKRRGLKIKLGIGDRQGEGLMRRLEIGPDPVAMLQAALDEAAGHAGAKFMIEDGTIYFEL